MDSDFCYERRDELIQYVVDKYGADKVAHIIAEGTMACNAVVRKVLGVYGYDMQETNRICKMIPKKLGITLDEAMTQSHELSTWMISHRQEAIDMLNLEGLMSHVSKHAAGIAVCPRPISDYVPCMSDGENREMLMTQWHKKILEELGIYKFDFLGLKTLTIISKTLQNIKKNRNIDIEFESLYDIDLQDTVIYEVLNSGDLCGIFQFDAPAGAQTIKDIAPMRFAEVVVAEALCRPGVKEAELYLLNRRNGYATTGVAVVDEILHETNGALVFQEQTMLIMNRMTGGRWTLGKADSMRKVKNLEDYREDFINCCVENGIWQFESNTIFDRFSMEYSFNKSHAAVYAIVSCITAYLKGHYRQEFMAASMSLEMLETKPDLATMFKECAKYGIQILPPAINKSNADFTVDGDTILYPITAINGIGEAAVEEILRHRSEVPFADMGNFLSRVPKKKCNSKAVKQLIKAGAFDELMYNTYSGNRSALLNDYSVMRGETPSQMTWCRELKIQYERESLGMCLTVHPLDGYTIREFGTQDGMDCVSGGIIVDMRLINDRNGQLMAFVKLENKKETFELVVFAYVYAKHKDLIKLNMKLGVKGQKDGGKMLAREVWTL